VNRHLQTLAALTSLSLSKFTIMDLNSFKATNCADLKMIQNTPESRFLEKSIRYSGDYLIGFFDVGYTSTI